MKRAKCTWGLGKRCASSSGESYLLPRPIGTGSLRSGWVEISYVSLIWKSSEYEIDLWNPHWQRLPSLRLRWNIIYMLAAIDIEEWWIWICYMNSPLAKAPFIWIEIGGVLYELLLTRKQKWNWGKIDMISVFFPAVAKFPFRQDGQEMYWWRKWWILEFRVQQI